MNSMDKLKQILEAVLLVSSEPVSIERMLDIFSGDLVDDHGERPDRAALKSALESLQQDYADRGVQLIAVASGYRFQTRADIAPWVNRLWEERPQKYSRALLETLAIIAYRQPITRGEIEDIRGVAVSANIMKLLTEREWVRVVGHRDVPGRPAVYATTRQFLDYFNLCSLAELPSLSELRDIDDINLDLFGNPMAAMGNATTAAGDLASIVAAEQDYAEGDADTDEGGLPAGRADNDGDSDVTAPAGDEAADDVSADEFDTHTEDGGGHVCDNDSAEDGEEGERPVPRAAAE